ncbi:helix-turn-helix domain-containing protein [Actinosynnema sp. NPDC023587]|uniref:helix-turn-helix domain-containing protein n=1 Tax=Actinosynnema sp. NPDC023587 TaxID=3154695 RepID=UPI0033D02370
MLGARPGHRAFVLGLRGVLSAGRGGRAVLVGTEELALCDAAHPLVLRPCSGDREVVALVMVFPDPTSPALVEEDRPGLGEATGTGALLRDLLVEATTRAPGLSASEATRTGEAALHLAAAVLERHFPVPGADPAARQHELAARIRAYIDRHLGSSALSPSRVAARHHISVRHLQRLFRVEGSTPSTWIRHRRLENAERDLRDAALRSWPIRKIGQRNGFAQASIFSRAFSARYGRPPGKFRDDWFRDVRS